MSDYIKEKVGEWETKFGFFFVEGKEPDQMTLKKAIKEDLLQSLQEMEERTREEERERIAKAMQPAFDDFNAAAQRMIEVGFLKRTGTEIIENIGYMKSVLLSPSEEKECACYCHYPATAIHSSDFRICPHCSPKKEKRGR